MQVIDELKRMSDERFLHIYTSLERQGFGPLDSEVAKALKFRPQAIRKLPMAQRAKRARAILQRSGNAELAYDLFGSYLLKMHKELVTGFLDATGVAHEDGMIRDTNEAVPDAAKVAAAIEDLDRRFAPEDVTLYLSIGAEQWPGVAEIQSAWSTRSRAAAATS